MKADIVPARWWEAGHFVSMTLVMARGRDPWADRVLARPWSPASLLEYLYMLDVFVRYDNFIVKVSGKRAGVLSLHSRPALIYVYSLGLLLEHQRSGLGRMLGEFLIDYSRRKNDRTLVASVAVANRSVHVLVRALGARLLGLSTTTLTITGEAPAAAAQAGADFRRLQKREAQALWRRWRLYEVEQVAGPEAKGIAAHLLEPLPRAEYRACILAGEEIGIALARRRPDGWEAGLFPSHEHWGETATQALVSAMASHFGVPIRRLTISQTHADALGAAWPSSLQYVRHRAQERHLVFLRRA